MGSGLTGSPEDIIVIITISNFFISCTTIYWISLPFMIAFLGSGICNCLDLTTEQPYVYFMIFKMARNGKVSHSHSQNEASLALKQTLGATLILKRCFHALGKILELRRCLGAIYFKSKRSSFHHVLQHTVSLLLKCFPLSLLRLRGLTKLTVGIPG